MFEDATSTPNVQWLCLPRGGGALLLVAEPVPGDLSAAPDVEGPSGSICLSASLGFLALIYFVSCSYKCSGVHEGTSTSRAGTIHIGINNLTTLFFDKCYFLCVVPCNFKVVPRNLFYSLYDYVLCFMLCCRPVLAKGARAKGHFSAYAYATEPPCSR